MDSIKFLEVKFMTSLNNKWVLVTGATRGIGRLCSLELAKRGCNLILHSRSLSASEKAAEEIKALGVEAMAVAAELSDAGAVSAMMEKIDASGVQLDGILNNAGLQIAYRSEVYDTPVSDYEVSFAVNTIAPMMICYHYLPKMKEQGFGRIVNVTSGIDKDPYQGGYSASKAALDKVTKDIATLFEGTDVMINLADPGWCSTDLGGPNAPNLPSTAVTGILLGLFADDKKSGRIFHAQEYSALSIEEALRLI